MKQTRSTITTAWEISATLISQLQTLLDCGVLEPINAEFQELLTQAKLNGKTELTLKTFRTLCDYFNGKPAMSKNTVKDIKALINEVWHKSIHNPSNKPLVIPTKSTTSTTSEL
jgi:hypothetical protein